MMWIKVTVLFSLNIFIACIDLGSVRMNSQLWSIKTDADTLNYYEFNENEVIKYSCSSPIRSVWIDVSSNAHEYTNISTKRTNSSKEAVDLFLKLTESTDGKQIDCVITRKHEKPILIRMILKRKAGKETGFGFHINGGLATSTACDSDLCFAYYYYDEENVAVESFKNNTLYGDLNCDGMGENYAPGPKIFFSKTLRVQNNPLESLTCKITSTPNGRKNIELKFIPNGITVSQNPMIKGLTMSRTLALFQKDEKTMTILYEYYDSEVLDLVCVSKYVFPSWIVEDLKVEKRNARDLESPSKYTIASNETIINGRFWLQGDQKTANISCTASVWEDNSKSTEVMQQYRTEVILIKSNRKIPTNNDGNDEENVLDESSKEDSSKFSLVLIGAGAAGVIALMLVFGIILMKILKRKRVILKTESNMEYESLPEHKEGPMPVPSQWDEATYSYASINDQNLDKMYTKALPKSQRNNAHQINLAHAMYTKPIPKHKRNDHAKTNEVNTMHKKPIPKNQRSREQDNLAYASIEDITDTHIKDVSNNEHNKEASKNSFMAELGNLLVQKFKNGDKPNEYLQEEVNKNENPYANIENSENFYVNENEINVKQNAEINNFDKNPYTLKNIEEYKRQQINFGENSNIESLDDPNTSRCYVNISDISHESTEPAYCNLSMTKK